MFLEDENSTQDSSHDRTSAADCDESSFCEDFVSAFFSQVYFNELT